MTKKSYSDLIAEVAAQLPTNHQNRIQAVNVRTVFDDLIDTTVQVYVSPSITGRISAGQGDPESLTGTQVTSLLDTFTTSLKGLVPAPGSATGKFLRDDGSWATGGGGGGTPGGTSGQVQYNNSGSFGGFTLSGDATLVTSTGVITIASAAVTYAKIQNVSATSRFLGRISSGAGTIEELTGTQATSLLDTFSTTTTTKGLVPGSNNVGNANFLRADGSWVAPPSGGGNPPGGSSGQVQYNNSGSFGGFTLSGDATLVTSTGVITIANSAVTYAKIQNVSATSRFLGRITAGAGVVEELTGTQATSLLDTFSTSTTTQGVVPGSNGVGSTNFLRADGTWAVPPGGGTGTPGGASLTVQYNNAGSFGGMSGTSWDDTNRSLTLTGTTVTTSNPIINATQIWNAGVVVFTGIKLVITDTASSSSSSLMTLGTNTGNKFIVDKSGNVFALTFSPQTGTLTTSTPAYNAFQTWNNSGVTFVCDNINITDTASSVSSLFEQFQVSSSTKWAIRKDGTVTTGIWGGTAIGGTFGGTGQTSYAIGDILTANTTTTLSRLADVATGNALISGGTSTVPSWGKIGLATHVTGNLPVTNLNGGIGAGTTNTFWRGDGSWSTVGPASTTQGCNPIWSSAGALLDGFNIVNALAFATPGTPINTGVNNAQPAIQAALNTGHLVYLPRGVYLLNSGLTVNAQGSGLIADAPGTTVLMRNFTSGDTVAVQQDINYFRIENIDIQRQGSAPVSGFGIALQSSGTLHTNNNFQIHNVNVSGQFIGIHIGSVSFGYMSDVNVTSCVSHGIFIDGQPAQVQMTNILCASNGGDGFLCADPGSGDAVGQWRGLATYNNSGWGFYSTNYANLRVIDSFFGNDHSGCVYVGTGGSTIYEHIFTAVETELSPSGYGFYFDAGMVAGASLVNCSATGNGLSGVLNNSTTLVQIIGGHYMDNGRLNTSSNNFGILNFASGARMFVAGVRCPIINNQINGVVSNSGTAACTTIGVYGNVVNNATLPSNTGNF